MLMMQIRHSDNLKSRCSNMGNCVVFRVQIVFFCTRSIFFEAGNVRFMHFLYFSEQKNANLARFLQELDSKNAFSYKILQEFL